METTEIRKPIEKEFFILTVDKLNEQFRIYESTTIKEWIKNIGDGYKIEYTIDVNIEEVAHPFVADSMWIGTVTNLRLDGDKLYGTAKFKIKGEFVEQFYQNDKLLDSLTLTIKCDGEIDAYTQKVYNCTLIGFSLIEAKYSTFLSEEEIKLIPELV